MNGEFAAEGDLIQLITDEDDDATSKEAYGEEIPILSVRNTVLFPGVVIPITVGRQRSIRLVKKAQKGISLNQIAHRKPTHVYCWDSCPAGLGKYSNKSFAWRFKIPSHLQLRASNNLLEHLAAVITPWVDIIAGRLRKCIINDRQHNK